ncbi:tyrosine-type recombinase/integrase [Chloroflexota bacterium]
MEAKTLGVFLFIYEKFATSENKSPRTIESVINAAKKFDFFLGGCSDPGEVQAEDLRRYIRYIRERPKWFGHPTVKQNHGTLSDNAIASYVRSIRSLWSWLKREYFIAENPFERVRPPRITDREVNPLTPEDVSALLKTIPKHKCTGYRDACMIVTMYGTGLRISEVIDLKHDMVNFVSGQIKVIGKGKKERSVFMSASLFKALFKYHSQRRPKVDSQFFFLHEDGRPLTRFYFEHRMQAYVRKFGITTRCTPHVLRYSFAIQFLRNGSDPFTLQKILGHESSDMTGRYLRIANTDVEKNMKAFSPAEQLGIKL